MSVKLRKAASVAAMTAAVAVTSLVTAGSVPAGATSPTPLPGATSSERKPILPPGTRVNEPAPDLKPEVSMGDSQSDVTALNYPCWTSFNPLNPMGGPMTQTYNNCASHGSWVQSGYWKGGSYNPTTLCYWVAPSNNNSNADMIHFVYTSTVPSGANYVTKFCT